MSYRYVESDPRTNPAHYMYAPFEGPALLSAYVEQRRHLVAGMPRGREPDPRRVHPPPPSAVRTADCLAACAASVAHGRTAHAAWADFFLRKVEIAMCLRAAYAADGRMSDTADAGADAYACAAFVFVSMATASGGVARLRWLNACLKAIDILTFAGAGGLSPAGAHCARQACDLEVGLVRLLAASHRVACP